MFLLTLRCVYGLQKNGGKICRTIYFSENGHMSKKMAGNFPRPSCRIIYLSSSTTHTFSLHQMSLASHTTILFHSSFNFLHMSPIKPHTHIHFPTHISQQSSNPKHHITHLIFQLFHASRFTHFTHFIPYFLHPFPQLTFLILQASTSFQNHSLYTLSYSLLSPCISISFSNNGK
jgi:hypothetical protein